MDPIAAKLLEYGILGLVVLVLGVTLWRLSRAFNAIQEMRIAEAKAVTDRILALSTDWLKKIGEQTDTVHRHNDNVTSLRNECRERTEGVANLIRDMISQLRHYADEVRRATARRGGGSA